MITMADMVYVSELVTSFLLPFTLIAPFALMARTSLGNGIPERLSLKSICVILFLLHHLSQELTTRFKLLPSLNIWVKVFFFLFFFRYLRLLVHMVSFWTFRSYPVPKHPKYSSKDVTVIIPSVSPSGAEFDECIDSVHKTKPAEIIIVTVGSDKLAKTAAKAASLSPKIKVTAVPIANKRVQICEALKQVWSRVSVLFKIPCKQKLPFHS